MADVEVASVLPKELRLGVPPKMPQARSYLFRQQSTISSYGSGSTIQINIPRLQRSYLRKDSYLRFTLSGQLSTQNINNAYMTFDTCGAWGLFDKIEVFDYLGSTVLESISGIPQLMSLLIDMGFPGITNTSNGNSSYGLGLPYTVDPVPPFDQPDDNTNNKYDNVVNDSTTIYKSGTVLPPSSGDVISQVITAGESIYFCREFAIPLPSFLGLLSDKMIPLHNGFTIVLTLASQKSPFIINQCYTDSGAIMTDGSAFNAFNPNAPPGTQSNVITPPGNNFSVVWNVEDVNMDCQILELGPVAESMMMSSTQGQPFIVNTKSFRYYQGSVSSGSSEFTLNLNLNVASLSNILWFMRSKDQLDTTNYASYGQRTRNFLQRWVFQYGSSTLPQNNGIQAMLPSVPTKVLPYLPSPAASHDARNIAIYQTLGDGFTESYNELMKSRFCDKTVSMINSNNYPWDFKFGANLFGTAMNGLSNFRTIYNGLRHPYNIGRFACGLNLELANNKNGTVISGLNTNGMNTSIRGYFHPSYLANMDSVVVDAYAEYDAFINISPGIATTVSF